MRSFEGKGAQGGTYVQLLVVAGALLAGGLELLAHLADLLVDLGVLCGRHGAVWVCVSTVSSARYAEEERTLCLWCVRRWIGVV